jgi:hypothetical protein
MRVPRPIHHIPHINPQRRVHERPRHPAQRRLFQAALRDGRRARARIGLFDASIRTRKQPESRSESRSREDTRTLNVFLG